MLRGVCGPDTLTGQLMAYEPKTEAGKAAITAGADPAVIEEQEASGELVDVVEKKPEQHVEKTAEEKAADEAAAAEAARIAAEGAGGDDDPDNQPNRTPQSMPVWKHKEELSKLRKELSDEFDGKLQQELAKAATKVGGSTSEDVTKIAEEFNLTPETAGALLDRMTSVVESRLGLGDIKKSIDSVQQREREVAEQQGFESEWAAQATQEALKAVLGERPITEEVKAKVKELAYTTTYAKYRLTDIIRLNPTIAPEDHAENRSAEGGRGGAGRAPAAPKSLDDLSPEQINEMSDSEFLELSTRLAGGQSRFTRTTKPKGKA